MSASGFSPSDTFRMASNAALYSISSILKFIIGISRVIVFLCKDSSAPISWSRYAMNSGVISMSSRYTSVSSVSFDGLFGDWVPSGFAANRILSPSRGLFMATPDSPISVGAGSNIAKNATASEIMTTAIIIEVIRIVLGRFAFRIRASVYSSL